MITVDGGAEIALVAAAVRREGTDRKIVNDMAAEIRRGVGPVTRAIREYETEVLPHGGGLNVWVAKATIRTLVRRGAKSAGVLIRQGRNSGTGRRSDLKRLDSTGRVRHLTWGHRPWSSQTVVVGAFTQGATPELIDQGVAAVIQAADNAAERIVNA